MGVALPGSEHERSFPLACLRFSVLLAFPLSFLVLRHGRTLPARRFVAGLSCDAFACLVHLVFSGCHPMSWAPRPGDAAQCAERGLAYGLRIRTRAHRDAAAPA